MLQFSKDFFDGEERDGFYIEPMMKNAWAAQLEVLAKVDAICKENDITYFADWGTLLGAVRHQGFIPWDDDMDIGMLRPDLERFRDVVRSRPTELICLDMYSNPDWGMHAVKVLNSTKFIINRSMLKEYHGFPFSAGLDIFPLDYVPRDKKVEEQQMDAVRLANQMAHLLKEMEDYPLNSLKYAQGKKMFTTSIPLLEKLSGVSFDSGEPTYQDLIILVDQLEGQFSEEDADVVTAMHRLAGGQAYYVPKEAYREVVMKPFENIMIPVPAGYDLILRLKYGDDYMTPKKAQGGHDYPFYGSLIKALSDKNNKEDLEKTSQHVDKLAIQYYRNFINKSVETFIQYDTKYFDCEIIDEIEVSEERKQIWAAQTEVLEEIKRICQNNKMKLFAIGNTLYDTIRYKHYGSNSEDLHLAIERKDYVEFIRALQEQLDPWFDYRVLYTTETHEDMRIYVITDGYLCDEEDYRKRFHGCSYIVGADISTIDTVDPNEEVDAVRKMLLEGLIKTSQNVASSEPYSNEEIAIVEEWKKMAKIDISIEGNLRQNFLKAADQMGGAFRGEGELVRITADLQEGNDTLYKKEWFSDVVELPFGETKIPVPIGYQEMIK